MGFATPAMPQGTSHDCCCCCWWWWWWWWFLDFLLLLLLVVVVVVLRLLVVVVVVVCCCCCCCWFLDFFFFLLLLLVVLRFCCCCICCCCVEVKHTCKRHRFGARARASAVPLSLIGTTKVSQNHGIYTMFSICEKQKPWYLHYVFNMRKTKFNTKGMNIRKTRGIPGFFHFRCKN